jgi:hypothetical protein
MGSTVGRRRHVFDEQGHIDIGGHARTQPVRPTAAAAVQIVQQAIENGVHAGRHDALNKVLADQPLGAQQWVQDGRIVGMVLEACGGADARASLGNAEEVRRQGPCICLVGVCMLQGLDSLCILCILGAVAGIVDVIGRGHAKHGIGRPLADKGARHGGRHGGDQRCGGRQMCL